MAKTYYDLGNPQESYYNGKRIDGARVISLPCDSVKITEPIDGAILNKHDGKWSSGKLEVVVAGKKKLELKVASFPEIPENEVWINTDEMKVQGLSDNSIACVRKAQ